MTKNSDLFAYNYVAAFIDLLGQKEELSGCGLLPPIKNEKEKDEFLSTVKRTIGAINNLQSSCKEMFDAYTNSDYSLSHLIPEEKKEVYENMKKSDIKFQRWSDGLVPYISLGNKEIKTPMTDVFGLMAACGSLCLLGLAKHNPIRGGLEIAWGTELHDNELYGCVVAKAYQLESEIAQYPRIVVGPYFIEYLHAHIRSNEKDDYSIYNRLLAKHCVEMLALDDDGYYFIDYLGEGFNKYVAKDNIGDLSTKAYDFILKQSQLWQQKNNTKLAFRYGQLRAYFNNRLNITNSEMGVIA